MSGSRANPNPENQSISLCLAFSSKPVRLSNPTRTLAASRSAIVYLLVAIKLSHDRTDIHIVAFFFLQKMDLNKDGVVTLEEFLDSCMSDEDISQSMAVFDSAF